MVAMDIFTIHTINCSVGSIFGIGLNVVILFLLAKSNAIGVGTYNMLLIQTCVIDIVFSLIETLVWPTLIVYKGAGFMIFSINIIVPRNAYKVIGAIYGSMVFCDLLSVASGFVYRYRRICHRQDFTFRYGITQLAVITLSSLSLMAVFFYCYNSASDELIDHMSAEMRTVLRLNNRDIFVGGWAPKNSFQQYVMTFIGAVASQCIYATIIVSYKRVQTYLKTNERIFSKNTVLIQHQITRTLVIQAILPMIFGVMPMLVMVGMIYLNNVKSYLWSACAMMLITWIPAANALAVLVSVKGLQKTLCRLSFGTSSQVSVLPKSL